MTFLCNRNILLSIVCLFPVISSFNLFAEKTPPAMVELKNKLPEKVGRSVIVHSTNAVSGRIVFGTIAKPGQFPFVGLAIGFTADNKRGICTCSLITRTFVLYAAHCIDFEIIAAQFFFGSVDTLNFTQFRQGQRVIKHPQYNLIPFTNMHDVALGQLDSPVTLNHRVQLAKLPSRMSSYNTYAGKVLTPVGFGLDETGRLPQFLKYTTLIGTNGVTCAVWFPITPNLICAQSKYSSGVCFGDSGGPLVYQDTLVGINDMFNPTTPEDPNNQAAICTKGQDAFVRVDRYLDWISSYTRVSVSVFE